MSGQSGNRKLHQWVEAGQQFCSPTTSTGATDRPQSTTVSAAHWSQQARSRRSITAKRPNSYWAHSDPGDVAQRRGPHVHLLRACKRRRRADEQLARSGGDARRS